VIDVSSDSHERETDHENSVSDASDSSTEEHEKTEGQQGEGNQSHEDGLRRDQGATIAEIAKATYWQNHSIRGFVSGHLTKKLGLKVESTKSEAGERTYGIVN
jgi:hypothetical protein